jgi:hypothetical protein
MKYKIAGINLLLSQAIIIIFLGFAYITWFPYSFYELNGVSKTVQILLLVNFCLGPLLILIIYKNNKNPTTLKFDLYSLITLQIIAFTIGSYAIYLKHPVYLVFSVDRFTLINASNATPEKSRYDDFKGSFFSRPTLVFAQIPDDPKKRNELLMGVLFEGKADIDQHAEYYEPFHQHKKAILARSLNTSDIFSNEKSKNEIDKFIKKYGGYINDYVYFPLQTVDKKDVVLVLIKETLQPISIIAISPWKKKKKTAAPSYYDQYVKLNIKNASYL